MTRMVPLEVYFGTIKCECEWIEFIPRGITFSVVNPIKCYPTLKFTGSNAASRVQWTRIEGKSLAKDGLYLFIDAKEGSVDDFDGHEGTGRFNSGSNVEEEKRVFVRFGPDVLLPESRLRCEQMDMIDACLLRERTVKLSCAVSRGTQWCSDDIAILVESDDEDNVEPVPPPPPAKITDKCTLRSPQEDHGRHGTCSNGTDLPAIAVVPYIRPLTLEAKREEQERLNAFNHGLDLEADSVIRLPMVNNIPVRTQPENRQCSINSDFESDSSSDLDWAPRTLKRKKIKTEPRF